jgi:hypothetical protein
MSRLRIRPTAGHHTTDAERWSIELLIGWGLSYKAIARHLWGGNRDSYEPSRAELHRIWRVCHAAEISPLDWRDGRTKEARAVIRAVARADEASTPRLRVVG